MNTYIEANLAFLGGSIGATISASESTSTTSYTDLTTVGPTVTVSTMTTAIVLLGTSMTTNVVNGVSKMSVAVSGASSISATDATCIQNEFYANNVGFQVGAAFWMSGLTPGSNIFTAKYQAGNSALASFANRSIAVVPLGV